MQDGYSVLDEFNSSNESNSIYRSRNRRIYWLIAGPGIKFVRIKFGNCATYKQGLI